MPKRLMVAFGLLAACLIQSANAQSSVTLYGVIDNSVEYDDGGKGSVVRAESSGFYATRWGIKGTEDLGGDLHVNFQLEDGFSAQTGAVSKAGEAFSRMAWVGMSGGFGEFRVGLQNTIQYVFMNPELDPLGVMSMASPMNNFNSLTIRENNAISYFAPTIGGVTAQFMVAMRDSTTTPTNGIGFYNAALRYVNGPFRAAAGYEQADDAVGTATLKLLNVGTSLGVGKARFYLAYHIETLSDGSISRAVAEASGSYMVTPFDEIVLLYGYEHDRTSLGNNAQQVGFNYQHFLSPRSFLYLSAGFIENRNTGEFTLNGTSYGGIAVAPGANTRGVIVGMVHKF
jgi:predicted porin